MHKHERKAIFCTKHALIQKEFVPSQPQNNKRKVLCRKLAEWMDLHKAEILTLWEKAQKGEKLGRIEPLK